MRLFVFRDWTIKCLPASLEKMRFLLFSFSGDLTVVKSFLASSFPRNFAGNFELLDCDFESEQMFSSIFGMGN